MPYAPHLKHEADFVYGRAEERVNQALRQAHEAARPVPPPQVLFPPRIGYDRTVIGIHEVLDTTRNPHLDYRDDFSGSRGSFTGTARPGIGML